MLILSGTVTMLQDCKNVFITAMIFTYIQEICLLCTRGPRGGSTGSLGSLIKDHMPLHLHSNPHSSAV